MFCDVHCSLTITLLFDILYFFLTLLKSLYSVCSLSESLSAHLAYYAKYVRNSLEWDTQAGKLHCALWLLFDN